MKRILLLLGLLFVCPILGQAMEKAQGFCEDGGYNVHTQGLASTDTFQRSFKSCTIGVYNAGTNVLATIYDDNQTPIPTPKPPTFTAASDGYWFFYAPAGRYDVRFYNGGIPTPFTHGDYLLCDPIGPNADASCVPGLPAPFDHNLLSVTHLDTVPYTPPEIGDLVRGNLNQLWERLGVAQVGEVLSLIDAGGNPYPEWVWPSTLDTCTSVQVSGVEAGCEHEINFIPGTNITSITAVDDSTNGRNDVTINAASTPPAPPRYSVQFNNPLGSFDGSSTFTNTPIGGAAPNEVLAVNINSGSNFEIDALTDPTSNYLFSVGPHTFIYSNGANGPGQAGGIQALVSDQAWPPEVFPAPVTITDIAITSNVLTVTNLANSTSFKNNYVLFNGLTTAVFLNGQIVFCVNSTATSLTCTYVHADYPSAPDTGTASLQSSSGPIPFFSGPTLFQPGAGSIGMQIDMNVSNSLPAPYSAGTIIGLLTSGRGKAQRAFGIDVGAPGTINDPDAKESAQIRTESSGSPGISDYSIKVENNKINGVGTPGFYVYQNANVWTRGNVNLVTDTAIGACTQTVGVGLWDCTASLPAGSGYGAPQSETMTVKICTTGPVDSFDWSAKGSPSCNVPTLMSAVNNDIDDAIRIKWTAITGHTLGDEGTIAVTVTAVAVYAGAQSTRDTVRAEVGLSGAIGSIYLSTAGKMYLKVANANATADWERVTTSAVD